MLRRILVPLDGSKFAEVALPVAMTLAERSGGEAHLVLVHEPELTNSPLFYDDPKVAGDEIARRERENSYLQELGGQVGSAMGARFSTRVLDGLAGPMLVEEIGSYQPDLVVLATHGRGAWARFWLGSMADYLLHHVSVPLLCLEPKDAMDWPAPAFELQSILVATDLSPAGEAIIEPAADLARATGARIELVHVFELGLALPLTAPSGALAPDFPVGARGEPERNAADEALDRVAGRLRDAGAAVNARLVDGVDVAGTLIALAADGGHGLIALATHGRTGLSRVIMGSVADRIVSAAKRPVLLVRSPLG